MSESANTKIQKFLSDIEYKSSEQLAMVLEVQKAFLSANNDLSEDIKYGGLVFMQTGKLIGGIFCYKKHVSIEFSNGAFFDDPGGLLEGKGKYRRHLKLASAEDFSARKCKYFITQAVTTG